MLINERLEHGLHNEDACNYLDKTQKYPDWVITTAFYSSIHFIEHKLFPLSVNYNGTDIEYATFDNYCYFHKTAIRKENPHKIRERLVADKLPTIAFYYKQLKSLSFTARYRNYKHSPDIANKAKSYLNEIKEYCTT
ncbi:MAG: hypothetical protein ACUZ8E_14740 [Candidatus Anammoxibacter sp.]